MLNIASFITPLAVKPDPNGAAANLVNAEHNWESERQNKTRMAEEGRHNQQLESQATAELGQRKQEHTDLMGEHERELHTKLTEWAMGVLDKEGMDKAREIAGPVLDAAGIGVDFGGGAGQAPGAPPVTTGATVTGRTPLATGGDDDGFAKLQAVQAANAAMEAAPQTEGSGGGIPLGTPQLGQGEEQGISSPSPKIPGEASPGISLSTPKLGSNYAPRPGESLSSYVARQAPGVSMATPGKTRMSPNGYQEAVPGKAKKEAPPTEAELDQEATEGPVEADAVEATRAIEGEAPAWRIYNKRTGETYGTIDPAKVQAINQERAYKGAVAYSKGTPEPGKAVVQEFTRGARDEADLDTRMKYAEAELNRQNKTQNALANHKGAGGPGNPFGSKVGQATTDNIRQYVQNAVTNSGAPKLNAAANDGSRVAELAGSPIALEQKTAAGQMLKSLFGAAASEGERAFVFGSEGEFTRLQQLANNWLNGGQMPPTFQAALQHAARKMQELAAARATEIARQAGNEAMDSPALGGLYGPLTPEQRAAVLAPIVNIGRVGTAPSTEDKARSMGF